MDILEKLNLALKNKYRFESTIGVLSLENLYSVGLNVLDSMYQKLEEVNGQSKSLLKVPINGKSESKIKSDIIKYVVELRLELFEKENKELAKKQQIQELTDLVKLKEKDELMSTSKEELLRKINELSST